MTSGQEGDEVSNVPAIGAGLAVGLVAAIGITVAVIIAVILFLRRKKKRKLPPIPGIDKDRYSFKIQCYNLSNTSVHTVYLSLLQVKKL